MLSSPPDHQQAMSLLLGVLHELRGNGEALKVPTAGHILQALSLLSHCASMAGHGEVAKSEMTKTIRAVDNDHAIRLYSMIARHCANAGHIAGAEKAFVSATKLGRPQDCPQALLDRGILTVARGETRTAVAHFEAARDQTMASLIAAQAEITPWSTCVDEVLCACNNLAVCQLSARELAKAVAGLEALIRRDPVLFLKPCAAQNLSSLYEFLPDSKERRMCLRELVDAFQLDDLDPRVIDQPGG